MTGQKHDQGKLRYDLIEPAFLRDLAAVLTMGAEKYEEDGWKHVPNLERRYAAALMRHFEAIRSGQEVDEESGLPHIAHVACNAMFLHWVGNLALRYEYDEDTNVREYEREPDTQNRETGESGPGCDEAHNDETIRFLRAGVHQVAAVFSVGGTHESFRACLNDLRDNWDQQVATRAADKTAHCEPDEQ